MIVDAEPHVVDARSVALLRILLSLYIITDIVFRLYLGRVSLAWYTSSSVSDDNFPSIVAPEDSPHGSLFHKIWFYRGSERLQIFSFLLTLILAVLFGIGFGNNYSIFLKALLWMSVTAMQNRAPLLNDGSDRFLRCILLWNTFIPMNLHWSVDSYLSNQNVRRETLEEVRKNHIGTNTSTITATNNINGANTTNLRQRSSQIISSHSSYVTSTKTQSTSLMKSLNISKEQTPITIGSVAVFGLTLQIALMYLGTVCNRLPGTMWLPPSLEAVYYAMRSTFATKQWSSDFIASNHIIYKVLTFQAMCIEALCPLMCIVAPCNGESWRHIPALIIFSLHLGLFIFMRLPQWQCLGMICTVIWIPTCVWDKVARKVALITGNKICADSRITRKYGIDKPESLQKVKLKKHSLKENCWNILTYSLLLYMVYNWCGERGWIRKHDNGDIGEAIQFSQHWVMYGPDPPVTCYTFAVIGQMEPQRQTQEFNYHYIDFLASLKSTKMVYMSHFRYNLFKELKSPENMSERFPSWRWENAFNKISEQRDGGGIYGAEMRFKRLIHFLCYFGKRQLAQSTVMSGNHKLLNVEIIIHRLNVLPPGSKERFQKESQTSFREQCS